MFAHSDRIKDLNQARALMEACNNDSAVIKWVEQKQKAEHPPLLYDLTSLQRDANRIFGFTAQQTLDFVQSLYEKRLLTYPRTDSRYLTHDMEPKLKELSARVAATLPFVSGLEIAGDTKRVVNDQKVSDHHAIIPTDAMPGSTMEIKALLPDMRDLLNLVSVRFLCAVDEPMIINETIITLECAETEFKLKGKQIIQMGWQRIWQAFRGSMGNRIAEEKPEQDADIPTNLKEGKVSRTKKCIIDALLYLIENDEYEKITVTQITQEADVARRTFYLNYNSKYEVLESYINILYEEYTAEVLEQGNRSFEHDVSQFFAFWEKHSEILFLLEKNNIFMVLLSKFEEILAETEYFDFSFWYDKGIDKDKRDYIASILAAILWRVLERWVKNDMKEPVEELVDTFMKTIK